MAEKKTDALEKVKSEELEKTPPKEVRKAVETIAEKVVTIVEGAGTITFTKKQRDILFGPVNEQDIEIRLDGLIYAPWMEYVTRLRDAFSGNWAILPDDKPRFGEDRKSIMWGFYLFIDGKPYGYAIGEQNYFPDNPNMSWSDACEGAKSNALMRLCKGLGVSLELWKPSFIKKWKNKYAEKYWDDKEGKNLWRKKSEKEKQETKKKDVKEVEVVEEEKPKEKEKSKEEEAPKKKVIPIEDSVSFIQKDLKAFFGNKYNKGYPRFKRFLLDFGKQKELKFVSANDFGKLSLHLGDPEDVMTVSLNMGFVRKKFKEWEDEHREEIEQEEKGHAGDKGEDPFK